PCVVCVHCRGDAEGALATHLRRRAAKPFGPTVTFGVATAQERSPTWLRREKRLRKKSRTQTTRSWNVSWTQTRDDDGRGDPGPSDPDRHRAHQSDLPGDGNGDVRPTQL